MYPEPPLADAVALPLFNPQVVFVTELITVIAVDEFTVAVAVVMQPFALVTVTL